MADYGFSLTTFSPTGKLVQIEYALSAVNRQGKPALGIVAKDGVVVAAEKKVTNSIIDETTLHKAERISDHLGCVYAGKKKNFQIFFFSGMPADFRIILARARKEAAIYERTYSEPIPTVQLVKTVAAIFQEFTQSGGVRPFGCSLLICGVDDTGCRVYQVDPSGTYFAWKATAIGRDMQTAKTFLEKRYKEDMELDDAIHTAILTIKELFEGAVNENNIEIGVVRQSTKRFELLRPQEIKDYLGEAE